MPVDNVNRITPCSSVSSSSGRVYERGSGLHTPEEITAATKPLDGAGCGIYFLVREGVVVYVGQGICVLARIASHSINPKRPFDSWTWLPCERSQLDALERAYITALVPAYNDDWESKMLRVRLGREQEAAFIGPLQDASQTTPLDTRGYKITRPCLTDTLIATLYCPNDRKDTMVFDGLIKGLGIRITETGKKIFLLQYRSGGRIHRKRLGVWPTLTAHMALKIARARLAEVRVQELREG